MYIDICRYSAIKYISAKVRSQGELDKLQAQAQPTKEAPTLIKVTGRP